MARTDNLTNYLTDVAIAIKTKKGDDTPIIASNFDTEIANLPSGGKTFESQGFANDSWELISQIAEAGVADLYYNIGDEKIISNPIPVEDESGYNLNITSNSFSTSSTEDYLKIVIVDFNHFESTDNPGKKNGIVLCAMSLQNQLWLTGFYGFVGGTDPFSLKGYLNTTVLDFLNKNMTGDGESVIKMSTIPVKNNFQQTVLDGNYKIFIPSLTELGYYEEQFAVKGEMGIPLPFFMKRSNMEKIKEYCKMKDSSSSYNNIMTRSMVSNADNGEIQIVTNNIFASQSVNIINGYGTSYKFYCPIILFCV